MAATSFPVPFGVGASFSAVVNGGTTGNFTLDEGGAVMTFQPVDPNNPGTAALYTSAGTLVTSMTAGGYQGFQVPVGGQTYYFTATQGANILAGTSPNSLR